MQYLVTGEEMNRLDKNTSEHFGVPPVVLMEQAALAFVGRLLELHPDPVGVLVLCGCGNNGGDGVAIARLLNQRGIRAVVHAPCRDHASELFRLQMEIYERYGYPIMEPEHTVGISDSLYDVVVDAIFGTGLSRPVGSPFDTLIARVNELNTHRVAVDIPSGISSETGNVLGIAFQAKDTITFSFGKLGCFLGTGAANSGQVHVVPISISEESFLGSRPRFAAYTEAELIRLPRRQPDSHKGTYGKLLVIAGSHDMAGAAVLSARAAYRVGCGLVKVVTPQENGTVLLAQLPEAVLVTYDGALDRQQLMRQLEWADAVVLGPGIGSMDIARELLETVLGAWDGPLVIDADALNLLSERMRLLRAEGNAGMILTPHLGEMSRLTGKSISAIKKNLTASAMELAQEYGVVCVLKDSHTVIAMPDGTGYVNTSGNNGMATAGSGDVLSGVLGGLLAQGTEVSTAAPLGVYLHGLAGDEARNRLGAAGMMAGDITDGIYRVLHQWERADVQNPAKRRQR